MMSPDETLALYDRRRTVSRPLSTEMFKRADRETVHETARKLGILHGGMLMFDSETEVSVLRDACMFEAWAHGENIVMQALRTSTAPPGSAEREILEAWCKARFSLYLPKRSVPGVGAYLEDVLRRGDEIFVVDRGLSHGPEGVVFAGRLVFFPEFAFTTGAGIPLAGPEALLSVGDALSRRFGAAGDMAAIDRAPDGARADLFFLVVRTLLALHQTRYVEYAEGAEQGGAGRLPGAPLSAPRSGRVVPERSLPRVGRNEPCPCGSGRKYKKCHGA